MNSHCIIVLGAPRSGTSAVAGTLHRLGVDMGKGHFQLVDSLNARGYYEDLRWQRINKALAGARYTTRFAYTVSMQAQADYRALIAELSRKKLWGFKSPRACFTLHHIIPLLREANVETRLVVVGRNFNDIVGSIQRHSQIAYGGRMAMSTEEAAALIGRWLAALALQVQDFVGPIYEVDFKSFLEYPLSTAEELAQFCDIHGADVLAAIGWLDRGMVTQ